MCTTHKEQVNAELFEFIETQFNKINGTGEPNENRRNKRQQT